MSFPEDPIEPAGEAETPARDEAEAPAPMILPPPVARDRERERDREAEMARRLAELDRKVEHWQGAYKAAVRDRELATALAGRPLVPGAATQLVRLWRDELDVIEEEGKVRVVARDGRPVQKAVTDWLSSPEFAHFRAPATRGGTRPSAESRGPANPSTPAGPRTLGENVLQQWRTTSTGPTSPSTPVGLGRRR